MCMVSAEARLTKTKILSMALDNGRHLLAYTNKAKNLSGKVNSMILPIPGTLEKEWFYNTTEYNNFLDNIHKQAEVSRFRSAGVSKGLSRSFEQFEVGFYKIVTTNDIDMLREHLSGLHESQRPDISDELLNFFKTQYKGWSFVVCIFSGDKEMDAQPIMFEYKPFSYDTIYYPTMDSHTGGAPDLNEDVDMDHTIIVDHIGLEKFVPNVNFSQEVPEILKRRKFVALKFKSKFKNGDMYLSLDRLNIKTEDNSESFSIIKRRSDYPGSKVFS